MLVTRPKNSYKSDVHNNSSNNDSCRFLSGGRRKRNVSNNVFTLLVLLPLLADCSSSHTITEGSPSSFSSSSPTSTLTALDPINTRPTRVEAEEAVSHTSPPQPLLLQSYTPLHVIAAPLLQESSSGRILQDADRDDEDGEPDSTTGFFSDPRLFPSSTPPTSSSSAFLPSRPSSASQFSILHHSPYSYHSSTSVRLLKASSLRQSDTRVMPPSYIMKEYLPSGKLSRTHSSSTQSQSSFSTINKDNAKSSVSKKSFLLHPHHPPPYPVPPRPPSSPPPLVPLWPDPPPSTDPFPNNSTPSPPSTYSPDPQSSTRGSINQSSPTVDTENKANKNIDIPKVGTKQSRIREIPKGGGGKPLGFSSIVHVRSNNLYFGRDKTFYFLRRPKYFDQERMRPISDTSGYPQYQQHMDEQNYPESPPFRYDMRPAPKGTVKLSMDEDAPKNNLKSQSNKNNITAALETLPNFHLGNWEDQLPENRLHGLSLGEEETLGEESKGEFEGTQFGEESMGGMQEKERGTEVEKAKIEGKTRDKILKASNNQKSGIFSLGQSPSFHNVESEHKNNDENKSINIITDIKNTQNLTEDHNNNATNIVNEMTTETTQKVNLEKLEMELSKTDEEATSGLRLAISILQHHMIPSLQKDDEEEGMEKSLNISKSSDDPLESSSEKASRRKQHQYHHYNIEMFDSHSSPSSSEVDSENSGGEEEENERGGFSAKDITDGKSNETVIFQPVHEVPLLPEHQACYRWFVLVLDGNCSVIKQRMSAFVIFLKAALSSKLSIDYNDVYVPSVFCDNTFMVNISIDTVKNPQAEMKLRLLAEANTTLLEISEEIFYLEKILTKRSDDEGQDVQPLVKKPDDVELVIYIAVGCMCVFILLSVVIVALIRVCRQEGDQMDIGKTLPHQPLPRPFDFPIRRPNVIYSHRFSQALIPDKCTSTPANRMENSPSSTGRGSIGVMAVTGSGRGSVLRYDTQFAGELMIGEEDIYSIGSPMDDPYNDRRALVPGRRRTTKVPGEEVILEEDIMEEEEEDLEEEDEEEDDDCEDDEHDDEHTEEKNKMADVSHDAMQLDVMEGSEDDAERCHFHISETLKAAENCRQTTRENKSYTKEDIRTGNRGRSGKIAGVSFAHGNAKLDAKGENKFRGRVANQPKSAEANVASEVSNKKTSDPKSGNMADTKSHDTPDSRTNAISTSDSTKTNKDGNANSSRAAKAKELLGSRLRGRRNLRPGYEVVFKGIDNPCYNR